MTIALLILAWLTSGALFGFIFIYLCSGLEDEITIGGFLVLAIIGPFWIFFLIALACIPIFEGVQYLTGKCSSFIMDSPFINKVIWRRKE